MIRKNITLFALAIVAISTYGQVTITNAVFPASGDTLKTITDLNPTGIVMTPPGGSQAWDFSGLQASSAESVVFQPASAGTAFASYPGADLVTIDPNNQTETYFDLTTSKFSILGFSGEAPGGGFPIQADFKYSPAFVEKRAPLNFFDINQGVSDLTLAFSVASIPSEIFDSLGIPSGLFDSIRVRINFQRLEVADAWGTLQIPGGTYDVLREKRTAYTTTNLDVHVQILGWVDISTLVGGQIPGLGTDTTIQYVFQSNAAKEYIAEVTTGPDQLSAAEITFKDNGVISRIGEVERGLSDAAILTPNPASGSTRLTLKNIDFGPYTLRMYSTGGQVLMQRKVSAAAEIIPLAGMTDGLYFYQVADRKGRVIAVGKLVVKGE